MKRESNSPYSSDQSLKAFHGMTLGMSRRLPIIERP